MNLEPEVLEAIYTNENNDLKTLSEDNCVMLVFLRHFGCTFCREALDDISKIKKTLNERAIKTIFVHMAENHVADSYLKEYRLEGEEHISDPDMSLYEYFGLTKGSFGQLYGLKVWFRGLSLTKYGIEKDDNLGNVTQMPGVFVLRNSEVRNSFVHQSAADKPDYLEITTCDCS